MLTNKELQQISRTLTLLTKIKLNEIEKENSTLFDETGITIAEIQKNIKNLNHILTHYSIEKMKQSDKVAQYHKDNAEKHREYNREWARKNYQKKKKEVK